MSMKRILAALLAMTFMLSYAAAEENAEVSETLLQQELSKEEVQSFVELLFSAAIGTANDEETSLRKDMTAAEKEARNAENATYRAKTQPWLIAAFQPKGYAEEQETLMQAETEVGTETDVDTPVYTTEDSYGAFAERTQGTAYLEQVTQLGGTDRASALQITREICALWMAQIDAESLKEMNNDYACWIYAPDSQIDYPVVHGTDNKYYLSHLFNGTDNSSGTLFMDYRNLADFQDPNTLIYGHHMRNGSMFGMLTHYVKQAYFESHPLALVMTEKEIFLLEFFAGYTTTPDDSCYDIAISDEEDMAAFVKTARRKSDFNSATQVLNTDRLVTLSTCAYVFENARYILIGKVVEVWHAEEEAAQ